MILKTIKNGKKTVAFIGKNTYGVFYAFGSPSQIGGYIAFNVPDIETAEKRIKETTNVNF